MDEVVPGLWIGDMRSALDVEGLKERNIFSIVSAMRGKVTIHAVCITSATVALCFEEESEAEPDIETNRRLSSTKSTSTIANRKTSSISFIQTELDKGHGVLVHCQAGISTFA
jgi:dual specificity phosphatase 12